MYWDTAQIIAANIRKLRRDAGMTVVELGEKLGTSPSNINHLEQGKHSHPLQSPTMAKICHYFQVAPKTLTYIKSWGGEDE